MLLPKTFLLLYLLLLSTSFIPNGTTARELVKPRTGGQTPADATGTITYPAVRPARSPRRKCKKTYYCRPPAP